MYTYHKKKHIKTLENGFRTCEEIWCKKSYIVRYDFSVSNNVLNFLFKYHISTMNSKKIKKISKNLKESYWQIILL